MHYEGLLKNPSFRGGFHEKSLYRGELPKREGEGAGKFCRFKEG